ncbi:MAG: hypothetical protein DCC75_12650 [Proteobacteria bacterium]|nr:MAG: hypothetical protein DCC75_12650 [Pseudomonadota bacterium]
MFGRKKNPAPAADGAAAEAPSASAKAKPTKAEKAAAKAAAKKAKNAAKLAAKAAKAKAGAQKSAPAAPVPKPPKPIYAPPPPMIGHIKDCFRGDKTAHLIISGGAALLLIMGVVFHYFVPLEPAYYNSQLRSNQEALSFAYMGVGIFLLGVIGIIMPFAYAATRPREIVGYEEPPGAAAPAAQPAPSQPPVPEPVTAQAAAT